jgi:hypothetical protein
VVGNTSAPPMVVNIAFKAESGMTGGAEGAAPAGTTPIKLTSITNVEQKAKIFFIFIRYSPQSMKSIERTTDELFAVPGFHLSHRQPPPLA